MSWPKCHRPRAMTRRQRRTAAGIWPPDGFRRGDVVDRAGRPHDPSRQSRRILMGYDIAIRGGRLVDGTGSAPVRADVGIENGLITAIGRLEGTARREIDAEGMTVTPGFVDIHTHLDAQIGWDPHCTPVSWH